jgi:hypothetical protein
MTARRSGASKRQGSATSAKRRLAREKPAKRGASKTVQKRPGASARSSRSSTSGGGAKKVSESRVRLKDPAGGLTAAGRKVFNARDGSRLKPGVKGPADTPAKMRRKGSFLRRHFATLRGPLVDQDGKPTRLALQAHAWGEPVPKTAKAAKRLAEKGARLLARYKRLRGTRS